MTHLTTLSFPDNLTPIELSTMTATQCHATVVVVSDSGEVASVLDNICDFLGFGIELLSTDMDVAPFLERHRPMAVVSELDGRGQDGCHVMMKVADYDPGLPILMLTGDDAALAGAVDAIEELWSLTGVTKTPELPEIGQLVEFLFQAGRRGDCVRIMPS
jgi:DNA-binding NtrC family response regulator